MQSLLGSQVLAPVQSGAMDDFEIVVRFRDMPRVTPFGGYRVDIVLDGTTDDAAVVGSVYMFGRHDSPTSCRTCDKVPTTTLLWYVTDDVLAKLDSGARSAAISATRDGDGPGAQAFAMRQLKRELKRRLSYIVVVPGPEAHAPDAMMTLSELPRGGTNGATAGATAGATVVVARRGGVSPHFLTNGVAEGVGDVAFSPLLTEVPGFEAADRIAANAAWSITLASASGTSVFVVTSAMVARALASSLRVTVDVGFGHSGTGWVLQSPFESYGAATAVLVNRHLLRSDDAADNLYVDLSSTRFDSRYGAVHLEAPSFGACRCVPAASVKLVLFFGAPAPPPPPSTSQLSRQPRSCA
jgi:hypothetical protein